jgi:7,8-didemethyl-8-hydroxy-5-deazariboflavin synthase CofG subunit
LNRKSNETDLLSSLISEKNEQTITYSKSLFYILTKNTPSDYTFGKSIANKEDIIVPYSIIKKSQQAKKEGVKEIVLLASERPDRNTNVRTTLDLWGLSSYADYLYTSAELSFLEGLTPIFEGGFLSPHELKKLSEIFAFFKILIPSTNLKYYEEKHSKDYAKKYLEIRLKMLNWTGKLNIPVISGIIISQYNTESQTKQIIDKLCNHQQKYNNIHSISIQSESLLNNEKPTKKSDTLMLKAVKYLQESKLDFTISIPPMHTVEIENFIQEGIHDLGSIPINPFELFPKVPSIDFNELETKVNKLGFSLHQRLPIKYDYIKQGLYSTKLGQVFDSIKYKIKKYEQEKLKDIKSVNP